MPPPLPEPQAVSKIKTRQRQEFSLSPKIESPTMESARLQVVKTEPKAESDLASTFKSDLTSIRNLVTCSICDQLLYEPFTIQCGHTYCYSCLCNWFLPNKRKKTCPECRTVIKQMPAPAFMVKQMVDIFTKRSEIMPADESVEQHLKNRSEETAAVERDRNSNEGLFKGLFPTRRTDPIHDEADGVHRCPFCHAEYTGGPNCASCGTEIDSDGLDFSGEELDELEALEQDLALAEDFEAELEAEYEMGGDDGRYFIAPPPYFGRMAHFRRGAARRRRQNNSHTPSISTDSDASPDDEERDSDSEDEGSLREFVVNDESPLRRRDDIQHDRAGADTVSDQESSTDHPVGVSDTDSDEGGPIVTVRGRRTRYRRRSSTPRPQIADPDDDDETDVSDSGDMNSVAERLRYDGWSPLHEGDVDERYGADTSEISDHNTEISGLSGMTDDESDAETMVGGQFDGDDRRRPWTTHQVRTNYARYPHYPNQPAAVRAGRAEPETDEELDSFDTDGDTEMSVSPDARGYSRDVYYEEDRYQHDAETDEDEDSIDQHLYGLETSAGQLGNGHNLHDLEDEESDWTAQPSYSRARPHRGAVQDDGYVAGIGHLISQHQNALRERSRRGSSALEELDFDQEESEQHIPQAQIHNSIPRRRRNMSNYVVQPARASQYGRSGRSPSVGRVISSSIRPARIDRRYHDRSGARFRGYHL